MPGGPFPPIFDARAPTGSNLSSSDQATLRRALGILKASRADAKSTDRNVSALATPRMISVLSYLLGFLDGKHLAGPGLNAGFQSVAPSLIGDNDLDAQLDQLEQNLEGLLAPGTRFWNLLIGGGMVAAGIALRVLCD